MHKEISTIIVHKVGVSGHGEAPSQSVSEGRKSGSISFLNYITNAIQDVAPFPVVVWPMLACVVCLNLCETGMKSLLTLYLKSMLNLTAQQATMAVHLYNFLKYFIVLAGAIVSDSFLGRKRTILYAIIIYCIGCSLLSISAAVYHGFPSRVVLCLAFAAQIVGMGGINPCLVPLAGDQFKIPEQNHLVKDMILIYFLSMQVSEIVSVLISPLLKEVECFGNECYALGFGVPAMWSIVSLILYVSCWHKLGDDKPTEKIIVTIVKCIGYAIYKRIKERKRKLPKFLDYASPKFSDEIIEDADKAVSLMSFPVPIYWAMYGQMSTTWTIQASRMDCVMGTWQILPGQVQMLCPLFLLMLVPLFHCCVYPIFSNLKIFSTLLRRMFWGMFLIALAYFTAAIVESRREIRPSEITMGTGMLTMFNTAPCVVSVGTNKTRRYVLANDMISVLLDVFEEKQTMVYAYCVVVHHEENTTKEPTNISQDEKLMELDRTSVNRENKDLVKFTSLQETAISPENEESIVFPEREGATQTTVTLYERKIVNVLVCGSPTNLNIFKIEFDEIYKDSSDVGNPVLGLVCGIEHFCDNGSASLMALDRIQRSRNMELRGVKQGITFKDVYSGRYEFYLKGKYMIRIEVKTGGVYVCLVYMEEGEVKAKLYNIVGPNTMSVLWMIPQYILIAMSSTLYTISTFALLYLETPATMKSLVWSMCYMTLSFGNLAAVFISASTVNLVVHFLEFGIVMIGMMVYFLYEASNFQYTVANQDMKD